MTRSSAWPSALLALVALLAIAPWSRAAPSQAPLRGQTLDFVYDGRDVGHPLRAYQGRIFLPDLTKTAARSRPVPLIVFLHGTNAEAIDFRWFGGGREGDVRRIVAALVEAKQIEPVVVAAPSTTLPGAIVNAHTSWPAFDLDRFVARTIRELRGVASIDLGRVIVVGHSGAGCNPTGGLLATLNAVVRPMAILSVDTCMSPDTAPLLATTDHRTAVVVSYQTHSWTSRGLAAFGKAFQRAVAQAGFPPETIREIEHRRNIKRPMPHDAMVPLTLNRWLPRLIGLPQQSSGGDEREPRVPSGR
ncbi:MAG: alpha/beta fold hydrolase [Deltaproteobacteria bacterium]|nr:alpha/beta fold hydrolase [Deltaproteobacteria bacterium]